MAAVGIAVAALRVHRAVVESRFDPEIGDREPGAGAGLLARGVGRTESAAELVVADVVGAVDERVLPRKPHDGDGAAGVAAAARAIDPDRAPGFVQRLHEIAFAAHAAETHAAVGSTPQHDEVAGADAPVGAGDRRRLDVECQRDPRLLDGLERAGEGASVVVRGIDAGGGVHEIDRPGIHCESEVGVGCDAVDHKLYRQNRTGLGMVKRAHLRGQLLDVGTASRCRQPAVVVDLRAADEQVRGLAQRIGGAEILAENGKVDALVVFAAGGGSGLDVGVEQDRGIGGSADGSHGCAADGECREPLCGHLQLKGRCPGRRHRSVPVSLLVCADVV